MRAFIALALLAAVAFADGSLEMSFVAGKNLTNVEGDFKFRYSKTVALPGVPVMGWVSTSVDADVADEKAKAKADVILGVGVLSPPAAMAAYASGNGAIELDLGNIASGIVAGSLDAKFQASAVAVSVPFIEEVDKDGNVVKSYAVVFSCIPGSKKEEGEVTYVSCSGKQLGSLSGPEFTVTYVTSKVGGILKYGQTPVSPRSFEMIVEGKNFKLQSEENHLRAKVALITASGKGNVKGAAQVRKVDGTEVYAAASSYVVVDGERVKVDVSVKSETFNPPAEISGKLLEAAFGGEFDARIASVDFPAGKTNFIYDPAVGAGSNVYKAGASTAVMSFFVVLVCALLALF